jgi:single-stranded DNA-binding protein
MAAQITIIGNLGADAERKRIGDNDVCNLRVGCKVGYGDRAVSTWWDVSVWGKPAEWAAELRKGDAVTVMGEVTAREHDGKTYLGVRASTVRAHERRESGNGQGGGGQRGDRGNGSQRGGNGGISGGWGGGQW